MTLAPFTACLVSLLAPPLTAAAGAPPAPAQRDWFVHQIVQAPVKLEGCAIGDMDPHSPGNEVVAVGEDGRIYLCREDRGHWSVQQLPGAPGQLVQCTIGELLPEHPGEELVVVGMAQGKEGDGGPGAAFLVYREEKEWKSRRLMLDSALLHACCITDVDPQVEGNELYVAGFGNQVWRLDPRGEDPTRISRLPGAAKSIRRHGKGLAVACNEGTVVRLQALDIGWIRRDLFTSPAGQARLGVHGDELVSAGDDGKLLHFAGSAATPVHAEPQKLRGAGIGELDPREAGLELAVAGYEGRLSVLYRGAAGWVAQEIHRDDDALHHLEVGEVDAESPGLEIVTCGHSGRLLLAGAAYGGRALAAPESGD